MFVCQWAGWSLITEAVSVEQPGTGCILPALINDALSVPYLWCPRPHRPGSTEPTSLVEQTVAAQGCGQALSLHTEQLSPEHRLRTS